METQRALHAWVMLLFPLLTAFGVSSPAADAPCGTCSEVARIVLACPHVPDLSLGESRVLGGGGSALPVRTKFVLLNGEGEARGELWVNHEQHIPLDLAVTRPAHSRGVGSVSWAEVLRNAREAAGYLVARFSSDEPPELTLSQVRPIGRDECVRLEFRIASQVGLTTFWSPNVIWVGVAADTGEVLQLHSTGSDGRWPHSLAAPSEELLNECVTAAADALRLPVDMLEVAGSVYDYSTARSLDPPRAVWDVAVSPVVELQTGHLTARFATVFVTAREVLRVLVTDIPPSLAGRVMASLLDRRSWEERGAELLRPTHDVDERWPVWEEDGKSLFILSQRPRPGAPWWRRAPSVVKVAVHAETLECVHAPNEGTLRVLSLADGLIAANNVNRHEVQLLRLRDGQYLARGSYPDNEFDEPSLAPDASAIVYSALRRHGDTDIFVDDIKDDLGGLAEHRRICRLEGYDHLPVFLGDSSRVCFAHVGGTTHDHGEGDAPEATTSLYVVGAGKPYWENDPPEEVVGGFTSVHRLSVFPDGNRVLVADENGLWVADIEAKTKTALGLPELHDPDLPDGPALQVRQPAVSPDGTRLAFSGYRDSGDPEKGTGWYIYVCDLDGSNLKRLTPLEDEPIPPYVFPETGKTAFDVAREIAEAQMEERR